MATTRPKISDKVVNLIELVLYQITFDKIKMMLSAWNSYSVTRGIVILQTTYGDTIYILYVFGQVDRPKETV